MSNSKLLPPFTFDLMSYLNRDELERFLIVCRPLKNFIERYFRSKPYRIFDRLKIRGGLYVLINIHPEHNFKVQWRPSRNAYRIQRFLDPLKLNIYEAKRDWDDYEHYSFAEMRPYLGPTVRVKKTTIYAAIRRKSIKKRKSVAEMESISYLWHDHKICIRHVDKSDSRIDDKDFQLILYSATILQCQTLRMNNAHFSFKDYKILYGMKVIEIRHTNKEEIDLWHQHWHQFLEQPRVKPLVVFADLSRENIITLLHQLSKDFSSAVSQNTFKIVFAQNDKPLTQFRETNSMSGEILELKKLPVEYQNQCFDKRSYTLERSSI